MATETLYVNTSGDECAIPNEGGCLVCPNHYTCVDESPGHDSDTTYIAEGDVSYSRDLYNLGDSGVGAGIINHVTVYFVAARNIAGYGRAGIKSGGVSANGAEKTITTNAPSYSLYSTQWVNPPEGGSWTWAKINALQAGVSLRSDGSKGAWARCTQVYVIVDYDPVVAPTVTTQAFSSIEKTTSTGNGNITDNGGENCDKRGIVYDTSSHGDPGNTAPADSDYSDYEEETDSFGTGAFTRSLTGLSPGQTYYGRAYAHNSAGYAYGDEVSFTTKSALKAPFRLDPKPRTRTRFYPSLSLG